MSKFTKLINKFVTCEIHTGDKVHYLAKLNDGTWTAVKADGSLDWVEITPVDLESMLETVEATGARVVFTDHSAV